MSSVDEIQVGSALQNKSIIVVSPKDNSHYDAFMKDFEAKKDVLAEKNIEVLFHECPGGFAMFVYNQTTSPMTYTEYKSGDIDRIAELKKIDETLNDGPATIHSPEEPLAANLTANQAANQSGGLSVDYKRKYLKYKAKYMKMMSMLNQ